MYYAMVVENLPVGLEFDWIAEQLSVCISAWVCMSVCEREREREREREDVIVS